mmetsp:Transcript_88690/g.177334  ORF Transcript_88690/g.177334 Transcript_88690/m.177334 type:complete len:223 (-) Transcript_88690:1149-1817(-)
MPRLPLLLLLLRGLLGPGCLLPLHSPQRKPPLPLPPLRTGLCNHQRPLPPPSIPRYSRPLDPRFPRPRQQPHCSDTPMSTAPWLRRSSKRFPPRLSTCSMWAVVRRTRQLRRHCGPILLHRPRHQDKPPRRHPHAGPRIRVSHPRLLLLLLLLRSVEQTAHALPQHLPRQTTRRRRPRRQTRCPHRRLQADCPPPLLHSYCPSCSSDTRSPASVAAPAAGAA